MNMTVWQVLSMFDAYQKPIVVQSGKGGRAFSGAPADLQGRLTDDVLKSNATCFSALPDGTVIVEYREE